MKENVYVRIIHTQYAYQMDKHDSKNYYKFNNNILYTFLNLQQLIEFIDKSIPTNLSIDVVSLIINIINQPTNGILYEKSLEYSKLKIGWYDAFTIKIKTLDEIGINMNSEICIDPNFKENKTSYIIIKQDDVEHKFNHVIEFFLFCHNTFSNLALNEELVKSHIHKICHAESYDIINKNIINNTNKPIAEDTLANFLKKSLKEVPQDFLDGSTMEFSLVYLLLFKSKYVNNKWVLKWGFSADKLANRISKLRKDYNIVENIIPVMLIKSHNGLALEKKIKNDICKKYLEKFADVNGKTKIEQTINHISEAHGAILNYCKNTNPIFEIWESEVCSIEANNIIKINGVIY